MKNNNIKQKIAANFNAAAASYDEYAILQQHIAAKLLQRLQVIELAPKTILDLGAGTAQHSMQLQQQFPSAEVFAVDFADNLLKVNAAQYQQLNYVCADMDYLPFADNSIDFVFSNCVLQWSCNLEATFSEIRRVLKPGAIFLFSTFGQDSLYELRAAFASVSSQQHINNFIEMHDLGDVLAKFFKQPVVDAHKITVNYQSLRTLLQDLRKTGANTVMHEKELSLSKDFLTKLDAAYQAFMNSDNKLPLSYDVLYGHAIKAEEQHIAQEFSIPLDSITKRV